SSTWKADLDHSNRSVRSRRSLSVAMRGTPIHRERIGSGAPDSSLRATCDTESCRQGHGFSPILSRHLHNVSLTFLPRGGRLAYPLPHVKERRCSPCNREPGSGCAPAEAGRASPDVPCPSPLGGRHP